MTSAIVLLGHGSRDPEWARPLRELQHRISRQRPDLAVEIAFLELATPLLPEAIEQLTAKSCTRIAIVPVFLAQGRHLRHDVPKLLAGLRQRFPELALDLWPALGETGPVLDAISAWIVDTVPRQAPERA